MALRPLRAFQRRPRVAPIEAPDNRRDARARLVHRAATWRPLLAMPRQPDPVRRRERIVTRPAIDPANMRRESTPSKVRRYWLDRLTGLGIVLILVGIASIDSLIP